MSPIQEVLHSFPSVLLEHSSQMLGQQLSNHLQKSTISQLKVKSIQLFRRTVDQYLEHLLKADHSSLTSMLLVHCSSVGMESGSMKNRWNVNMPSYQ